MNWKSGFKRIWVAISIGWITICIFGACLQGWVLYRHHQEAANLWATISSQGWGEAAQQAEADQKNGWEDVSPPDAEFRERDRIIKDYLIEKHLGNFPAENWIIFVALAFLPPLLLLLFGRVAFWITAGFRNAT